MVATHSRDVADHESEPEESTKEERVKRGKETPEVQRPESDVSSG